MKKERLFDESSRPLSAYIECMEDLESLRALKVATQLCHFD